MSNTHSIDLELDSNQYLSIADGSQTGLDITGDISMEAWIKLEQLPSTAGTQFNIFAKYYADVGYAHRSYYMALTTGDDLRIAFSDNGEYASHATDVETTSVAVAAGDVGKWVHFAVAIDVSAGAGGIKLYKNGVEITSKTTNSDNATSIYDGLADFCIGAQDAPTYSPVLFFDGLIDEVRVWNDIRTEGEIQANKNIQLNGDEAGLVGYWKLDNSLLDETSNNNDLTNNNAATYSADIPKWATPGINMTLLGVG